MGKDTSRRVKSNAIIDPYCNLAADVVIDAINIVLGSNVATEKEIKEAKEFLKTEKAIRWSGIDNLPDLLKRGGIDNDNQ